MSQNSPTSLRKEKRLSLSVDRYDSPSQGVQFKQLRPGLVLSIAHPTATGELSTPFEIDDAPIQFGFTYSGKNRCTYSCGTFRNKTHEMQTGSNGIFYLPKTKGILEKPEANPATVVAILASPDFLYEYFADSMDQLPCELRFKIEKTNKGNLAWFGRSNPAKLHLISQILNCPYAGGVGDLFLESRAIELLALQLNDYFKAEQGGQSKSFINSVDIDRIHQAKEYLVSDLENPPSLTRLAAHAGVNEKKLKHGFRQLFGTSVFGYFREYRLQKAYEILSHGNSNVTEAAYAIGYQSLSHFSHAFKERFGILPRDFLTNQRGLVTPKQ